jgi:hypothetical protein
MVRRKEKEEFLLQGAFFAVGAFAVALSSVLNPIAPPLGAILAKAGIGLVGYSSISLVGVTNRAIQGNRTTSRIDKLFQDSISLYQPSGEIPALIGTNIEGCISTAHRGAIDLRKLFQMRAYCNFLKTDEGKEYPPIVICTGRSQGYVELLAQTLGLSDDGLDLPFIIEMGAALYYPSSKRTESWLIEEEELLIDEIKSVLKRELRDIVFEPKSFIVTVNPSGAETTDQLYERIFASLSGEGLAGRVNIIRGNTAVDITPQRINKISALRQVVRDYTRRKFGKAKDLESIVYIAESNGDMEIINHVKEAYCSESEATFDVERNVRDRFGANHILRETNIDVFLTVLEKTCGIKIR